MKNIVFIKSLGCAQNRFDAQQLQDQLMREGIAAYHQGRFKDNILLKDRFEGTVLRQSRCVVFFICALCEVTQKYFRHFLEDISKINPGALVCVSGCFHHKEWEECGSGVNVVCDQDVLLDQVSAACARTADVYGGDKLRLLIEKTRKIDPQVVLLKRGCRKFCTYCVCPQVSREQTLSFSDIKSRMTSLGEQGCRRIEFAGPCIGDWKDQASGKIFDDVLAAALEEFQFRVEYLEIHPGDITDETIKLFGHKNLSKEISIPIQSASDRVLKWMNRGYGAGHIENVFTSLVDSVPDVEITTDVIVGFPGETDQDVELTVEFIRKFQKNLKRVDYYSYSPRGTASCKLGDRLSGEILDARFQLYQKVPHAYRKLE